LTAIPGKLYKVVAKRDSRGYRHLNIVGEGELRGGLKGRERRVSSVHQERYGTAGASAGELVLRNNSIELK